MADKYIRIADAIDEINHALDRETILFSFVRKVAISALKKLPSADVVQVVRCKDCKHFSLPHACWHDDGMVTAQEDGFCSYGERKEKKHADIDT